MTEMVERAAEALYGCENRRAGHASQVIAGIARGPRSAHIEPFEECADTTWRPDARAALLAALDPHDSALQSVILRAMGFVSDGGDFGPMARVQAHDAIEALRKASAQGERDGNG